MFVSIIIPVYNSREYLTDTVTSLLKQDYDDFEILLVDDGSSDGSGEICDTLAGTYENVRTIHKQNGGVCSARNRGMDEAQGEYVAFVDNDDECLPGFLSENAMLLKKYDADMIRFGRIYQVIRDGRVIREDRTATKDGYVPSGEFFERFDSILDAGHGVWAGMYRLSFIKEHGIRFDESMAFGYEDYDFLAQIYPFAPATVLNSRVYYVWKMRYEHSTSGKADINGIESLVSATQKEIRALKMAGYPEKRPADYLDKITEYIYTAVRYVSPVKVDIPWKERIRLLRCFSEEPAYHEYCDPQSLEALRKKSFRSYLVFQMFRKKWYHLLICTVAASHWLEEKRG